MSLRVDLLISGRQVVSAARGWWKAEAARGVFRGTHRQGAPEVGVCRLRLPLKSVAVSQLAVDASFIAS